MTYVCKWNERDAVSLKKVRWIFAYACMHSQCGTYKYGYVARKERQEAGFTTSTGTISQTAEEELG